MKIRESNFWNWLKRGVERALPPDQLRLLHWQRVENAVKAGTPDTEGCFASTSFWIELKCAERSRVIQLPHFTPKQAMFLKVRWAVGGNAWLLVNVGGHARYLIPGSKADIFLNPQPEETFRQLSITASDVSASVLFANISARRYTV